MKLFACFATLLLLNGCVKLRQIPDEPPMGYAFDEMEVDQVNSAITVPIAAAPVPVPVIIPEAEV